ncbi:MAG: hypothetical protein FWE67_13450 [Planctomycetaceae bacterium]|nr:hypothetical protein [Planctomycetaceae bacterium]
MTQNPEVHENLSERVLVQRINDTSLILRRFGLLRAAVILLTFICGSLFLAVLAEHWLFQDGLSVPLRCGILAAQILFVVWFAHRYIVPFFLYSINPAYSAVLLEKQTSGSGNSLLNWFFLRRERKEIRTNNASEKIAELVLEGVAKNAFQDVKSVQTDKTTEAKDIRYWSIVLLSILFIFAVYFVFSPKNPLSSVVRLFLPFGSVAAPQSIQFVDVIPGNATVVQGDKINVSVKAVSKLRKKYEHEPVAMFFSTDDGSAVGQSLTMNDEGNDIYFAVFPSGKQGFVTGTNYWFQQGVSKSQLYRIEVLPLASLELETISIKEPDYTGQMERTLDASDITAVEGSEVTMTVRSSQPLENCNMYIETGGKETEQRKLNPVGDSGEKFQTRFKLQTSENNVSTFYFQGVDKNGNKTRSGGRFRLEVLPDLPPMVRWVNADELLGAGQIEIPSNGSLELKVSARDPDYALRHLRLRVASGNKQIQPIELLDSSSDAIKENTGTIEREVLFSPVKSRLTVGDTAEIWAEAVDVKLPSPNVAETPRLNVKIVESKKEDKSEDNRTEEQKSPEKQNGEQNDENKSDKSQESGEKKEGNEQDGEQNENNNSEGRKTPDDKDEKDGKSEQPVNGEENPGDAIEKIIEQMKEDQKESEQQKQQEKEQEGDNQKSENQKGNNEQEDKPQNEQQKGEEQKDDNSGKEENGMKAPGGGGGSDDKQEQKDEENTGGSAGKEDGEKKNDANSNMGAEESEGGSENQQGNKANEKSEDESGSGEKRGKQEQNQGKDGERTETKEGTKNDTEGGNQRGNPNSEESKKKDDFPDADKWNVPVDPNDNGARERGDLDPSKDERRNQGSDKTSPKPLPKDSSNDTLTSGDEGHGQESPDSGSSERLQKSESGKEGEAGNQAESQKQKSSGGQKDCKSCGGSDKDCKECNGTGMGQKADEGAEGQGNESGASRAEGGESSEGNSEGQGSEGSGNSEGNNPSDTNSNNNAENPNGMGDTTSGTGGGDGFNVDTETEAARLDFAEKTTNLVLEYLDEQLKGKPNQKLLDKLNWTEEELRAHHKKWKELSEQSKQGGESDDGSQKNDEWKEFLKSIGLTPQQQRSSVQQSRTAVQESKPVSEIQRYAPPAQLRERFKRYTEGIGK